MTFDVSFEKLTRPITFTVMSCAVTVSPVQPMSAPIHISIKAPEKTGAEEEE